MSPKMFLILKGKPSIDSCRDGGSIVVNYYTLFGSKYILTLPIKWGGTREDMKVVGYREPKLEKRLTQKKISKGSGKPYYINSLLDMELNKKDALKIAVKIRKKLTNTDSYDLALNLVHGIESNGHLRDS
ncbi:hypothetical protein [Thalassolituus pacificus]|uniref:Uncharacterized protein n=2 Tax=cellular organisms TaxID=131567 RepID=A0A9X3ARK1_9GAMM|nr:hypothetical protein [Thalassolituus pacificus]MCT7357888.1 hypothetical protein [Thalassolituus pacificus]